MLVFSVEDRQSFESVKRSSKLSASRPLLLLGTGSIAARRVSIAEGTQLAKELGVDYLECDPGTGQSVSRFFGTCASRTYKATVGKAEQWRNLLLEEVDLLSDLVAEVNERAQQERDARSFPGFMDSVAEFFNLMMGGNGVDSADLFAGP